MFSHSNKIDRKQDTIERNSNHTASVSSASSASTINSEPDPHSRPTLVSSYRNNTREVNACLEEVQQGFLSGYRHNDERKINPSPKLLFRGATDGNKNNPCQHLPHHNRNNSDSNSSTDDSHSRRVALMMASPALPPRNNSSREKHRRRTRSSLRRTSDSDSANSGVSQSLLLNEYGESCDNDEVQSPHAARRRSPKLLSGAVSPSYRHRSAIQDTKSPTVQSYDEHSLVEPHHSEYYSPGFSSESSPDTSPSRLISDMYRLQQYQHYDTSSQGQQLSSSRLSRSSMRSLSRSSMNDSPTGCTSSYNPKSNTSKSPANKSPPSRNLQNTKTKAITSNISCYLAGTFIGMVILSLSGMILLTKRASPATIRQEQLVVTLFDSPDDSGLRGKQVFGRTWDTSATNSEDFSSSQDSVGSKRKPKKTASPKKKNDSSFRNGADFSSSKSETEKISNRGTTVLPHRLQMHAPPAASFKMEPKFDNVDRNLYYPSSISRKGTKDDSLPRIVMLDPSVKRVSQKIKKYPADFTDNTQLYGILSSDDERLNRMEMRDSYSRNECVPMQKWQTAYQPSCNGMHELALQTLGATAGTKEDNSHKRGKIGMVEGLNATLFGTKGFWRYAWKVVIENHDHRRAEEDTIVFKNLKYEHNFEDAHFEHDRIDAVAMERLTSSPHVINIFGFCGHSVMTEYADGKTLGALADKAKKTPLKRLEIARDIANGLADVHGIDGDGNTTFVHLDINPANVVSVNDTLKLNDFNIGIIRQWNTTSNEACGFPAQYPNPQWRSPEEALNEQHLTEKVDTFSLGHIFFRLICGHEPWNKLEPGGRPTKAEINEKVQRGELPFIPDHVRNSDNPEIIAIRDIMLKCYTFDPTERPSARYIADTLDGKLNDLKREYSSNPPRKENIKSSASAASLK